MFAWFAAFFSLPPRSSSPTSCSEARSLSVPHEASLPSTSFLENVHSPVFPPLSPHGVSLFSSSPSSSNSHCGTCLLSWWPPPQGLNWTSSQTRSVSCQEPHSELGRGPDRWLHWRNELLGTRLKLTACIKRILKKTNLIPWLGPAATINQIQTNVWIKSNDDDACDAGHGE